MRAGTALALTVVIAAAGIGAWWYVAPDTMPAVV